ncbi:Creatinase/aminopeptidase [Atractiella rhizophila]|nr:Creatinase/aminopeptidase [Atractiella rhizophila]
MGTNRRYCGHGINQLFHCTPNVPHYAANKAPYVMKPGNTFTIEPMITLGDHRDKHWPDNWTAVTRDGSHSAQFEETLLITEDGVEVLTAKPGWKLGDGWRNTSQKAPEASGSGSQNGA